MPIQSSDIFDKLGFKLPGVCRCGRVDSVIHCPKCGSSSVIVLKRLSRDNTAMLADGSRVPDRVFTCKQCSTNFTESTCFRACEAMPLTWQRESEVATQITPRKGELTAYQKTLLREVVKKHPQYKQTVMNKLNEPGLLERVDLDKPHVVTVEDDVDNEAAKLFNPPKLDEEDL